MDFFSLIEPYQAVVLQGFQSIRNPIFDFIFLFFTISTEAPIIVLVTAVTYWCINKKFGQRMLASVIGNIMLNGFLKDLFIVERPIGKYGLESMRVETATGHSFPSGHTQTATSFWSSVAIYLRKRKVYILAAVMAIGAGLSRLYLAVHWPLDVIVGLLSGLIFSYIIIKAIDKCEKNGRFIYLIVTFIPFLIGCIFVSTRDYIRLVALFGGFVAGYIVETKYINFSTISEKKDIFGISRKEKIKGSIKRCVLGLIVLGVIYLGMKFLISAIMEEGSTVETILYFLRYFMTSFFGIAVIPAMFKKMGI